MDHPGEPTAEQCSTHADLGDGWIAIWYPQMGGYVGESAMVKYSYNSCFEAYVWHDGEFPFDGEDIYGDVRLPRHLHHCDPDQFILFGEQVKRLVTKGKIAMTEPVRPLEALIAEKIAEWRAQSEKDRDHGDSYRIGRGWGLEECADELAALLQAAAPPAPTAELHRYTITSEGASLGYFRLVEDKEGAWVTWAEVEALLKASTPAAPPERVSEGKDDYKAKYHELLYAVGNAYPGESRHETALRYIRQAETSSGPHAAGCQCQIDAHDFDCPVHGTARPAVKPREEK